MPTKKILYGFWAGYLLILLLLLLIFGRSYSIGFLMLLMPMIALGQILQAVLKIRWMLLIYWLGFAAFLLSFFVVQLILARAWGRELPEGQKVDCLLVLGAGLQGNQISKRLQARLDKALSYARQLESLPVIVSGGQGPDELRSEAEAMQAYLVAQGLAPERILMEDRSHSTQENLRFSKKMLPSPEARVLLITSDYHLYRSLLIAKLMGYEVYGAAAFNPFFTRIDHSVREFPALIKDGLLMRPTRLQD